jgi:beta-1,4-glucosyltransferase
VLSVAAPPRDERRQLGPLCVRARSIDAATREILSSVQTHSPLRVAFANTHLLYYAVRDPQFAESLRSFYIINDGVGVDLLARLSCGHGFEENLNGTDLTPRLLSQLPRGTRVLLVGARADVACRAAVEIARRWPQLVVCGWRDGFAGSEQALDDLIKSAPDVVLAAMGNPRQERWIERAAAVTPGTVFIGVGAWFDFLVGAAPRAPLVWRRLHLEWAFRLAREPRRMWRRYTIEILVVLAALLDASLRRTA